MKINKNKIVFFLKYWLPVLLWLGLIFSLSSMKGNTHQGSIGVWFYIERKGAHIFEYLVLSLLLGRLFWANKIEKVMAIVLTISFTVLWAFSDEIHQLFIYGREGKISDVGIDSVGIFLAVMLIIKFYKSKTRN